MNDEVVHTVKRLEGMRCMTTRMPEGAIKYKLRAGFCCQKIIFAPICIYGAS